MTYRFLFSLLLAGLFFSNNSQAQGVSGNDDLPPAPQNLVLDDAGLFRDKPELLEETTQLLRGIDQRDGYPVYLAVYYQIFDGTLQQRADFLYDGWIGKGRAGMVIVYQTDPVTGGENPVGAFYRQGGFDEKATSGLISGPQLEDIFKEAQSSVKNEDEAPHGEKVLAFLTALDKGFLSYNKVESPGWKSEGNWQIMAIFAGALVALGLVALFAWLFLGKKDQHSHRKLYFPDVKVSRRLGAPYGGGWTSEKSFVPSSSRK